MELALASFVIGHIWRYCYNRLGLTSRSVELKDKPLLKSGLSDFPYGAFAGTD